MNFEINNAVFNKFPKLESKNLLFSEITNTHAESFFKMRSDTEVVKYMDTFPHKSIEQTIKLIELYQQSFLEHNAINWFILKKTQRNLLGMLVFGECFENIAERKLDTHLVENIGARESCRKHFQ
jgi:RimJ/RimL family protein N-acetyltransferase